MKIAIAIYFVLQFIVGLSIAFIQTKFQIKIIYLIFAEATINIYTIIFAKDPGTYHKSNQSNQQYPNQQQSFNDPPQQFQKNSKNPQKCVQVEPPSIKKISEDQRYCRLCHIFQPLRTKHCFDCEHCVATYDHHCPWMGNCIGQKNRHYFIIYLILQMIQNIFAISIFYGQYIKNTDNSLNLIMGLILIILVIVLFLLLCFHFYLMAHNLTTWQFLKWEKIKYLKKLERKNGSPFSKGIVNNFKEYWVVSISKQLMKWQYNKQ